MPINLPPPPVTQPVRPTYVPLPFDPFAMKAARPQPFFPPPMPQMPARQDDSFFPIEGPPPVEQESMLPNLNLFKQATSEISLLGRREQLAMRNKPVSTGPVLPVMPAPVLHSENKSMKVEVGDDNFSIDSEEEKKEPNPAPPTANARDPMRFKTSLRKDSTGITLFRSIKRFFTNKYLLETGKHVPIGKDMSGQLKLTKYFKQVFGCEAQLPMENAEALPLDHPEELKQGVIYVLIKFISPKLILLGCKDLGIRYQKSLKTLRCIITKFTHTVCKKVFEDPVLSVIISYFMKSDAFRQHCETDNTLKRSPEDYMDFRDFFLEYYGKELAGQDLGLAKEES